MITFKSIPNKPFITDLQWKGFFSLKTFHKESLLKSLNGNPKKRLLTKVFTENCLSEAFRSKWFLSQWSKWFISRQNSVRERMTDTFRRDHRRAFYSSHSTGVILCSSTTSCHSEHLGGPAPSFSISPELIIVRPNSANSWIELRFILDGLFLVLFRFTSHWSAIAFDNSFY